MKNRSGAAQAEGGSETHSAHSSSLVMLKVTPFQNYSLTVG